MSNTIPLETIRTRLFKIWFAGSAVPFLLMVIQTILGKYEPSTQDAWSWFIPLVFPTLTLMISVMGAEALVEQKRKVVRKSFSSITCWLSFGYLLVLSIVLLFEPFSKDDPLKVFSMANFFLAPLEALTVGAIGYLFTGEVKLEATDAGKAPDGKG